MTGCKSQLRFKDIYTASTIIPYKLIYCGAQVGLLFTIQC